MSNEREGEAVAAPQSAPAVETPVAQPAADLGGLSGFSATGSLNPAAVVALQRSAGNAAVTQLVARRAAGSGTVTPPGRDSVAVITLLDSPRPADSTMLMRYQAGSSGHGGIEERALSAAGFSGTEVKAIYAGNWLRDLSQLPKHPAVTMLIRILSMGEFGRDTSAEELGTYVPSEHMDNPEGGGTVEDPAVRADPARLATELAKLSPAQRAAYDREEAARGEILARSKASGLPEYIETGKFHAKEMLAQAVDLGRTGEGMRAMGNALHSIEDYYSHSNFTEAGIFMMRSDPAMAPLVARMAETHLGANPALLTPVDPATGQVVIQSGTYASGANDWVSRIELIQSEVENGELRTAFAVGWMRMAGITGEEIGRRLGEQAGGGVGSTIGAGVGGVGGGVSGAVSGAASGAAAGFARGRGFFGTIGSTLEGLATGAGSGAVGGAMAGAEEGAQVGGELGQGAGGWVGALAGREIGEIVGEIGLDVILGLIAVPFAAITAAAKAGILEKIAEIEVNASGGEARARGLSGPTHSELSKDAPEHRLFDASAALAAAADEEIGAKMIEAWTTVESVRAAAAPAAGSSASGPATPPPSPSGGGTATAAPPAPATPAPDPAIAAAQENVKDLVDKYVCHPSAQDWWKPILVREAARLGGGP